MSRIVFISPYSDLSSLAQSVAAEMGMTVEFYNGWMDHAVQVVKDLKGPAIDIIMSRGGTAEFLSANFDIPVIRANMGAYDIIECLNEAKKYSNNIAITVFNEPLVGKELLEKAFDVSITELIFSSVPDLKEKIAALAFSGKYCILGGGPSVSYAAEYGLPSAFLRTSRATLETAFLQAEQMANLRREETRKRYRLQAIMDAAYEGIIAVDDKGAVELYNKAAEKIFGIDSDRVMGKPIADCIPNTRLDKILLQGQLEVDEIQNVGDIRIITNRVPIQNEQEILGAVATFQELSKVVKAEQKIRKEITEKNRFRAKFNFADIIGSSRLMLQKKEIARNIAQSDLTVLIYGASGTGKELFAQSIHNASNRANAPFVGVNCGALPSNLLESELFGYEEGAFTGARRNGKYGLFELAHTGTIFLDEINSLPIEMQGRLLRVLQEREVLRVGGETNILVDVRVIAATNQPPEELLQQKKIREDLFYRLNVLYLELPPLVKHCEDIAPLCEYFIDESPKQLRALIEELMPYFERYHWPGNVRELYNVVQRVTFFADSFEPGQDIRGFLDIVAPRVVAEAAQGNNDPRRLRGKVKTTEDRLILKALKEQGTLEKTAAYLGIGRSTLTRKLKEIRSKEET
ncbi:MAG TPA: sigma 54-interacting transcriptional regulator [Patescibacteria group bacterium]|nr:sigma 54-interacting transcriptional regulator [Patescibacteria group bacterium]